MIIQEESFIRIRRKVRKIEWNGIRGSICKNGLQRRCNILKSNIDVAEPIVERGDRQQQLASRDKSRSNKAFNIRFIEFTAK